MEHEVVLERVPLPHQVEGVVDRLLDQRRGHRRQQGDAPGERARFGGETPARHDPVDQPEPPRLARVDRLAEEEELLGLALAELPRLDQQLDAGAGHAQDRIGELRVVGGDDQVAHAGQHEPGGDAGALHLRDGRLGQVVNVEALLEVELALVAESALRRGAQPAPGVGCLLADDGLEVVPSREGGAGGREDDHPHVGIGGGVVHGVVELEDERAVLGVADLRPVERDRRDVIADGVADGRGLGARRRRARRRRPSVCASSGGRPRSGARTGSPTCGSAARGSSARRPA